MSDATNGNMLVVGLGNSVLSDDRVGLEVAREVARRTAGNDGVEVIEACVAGLDLVELLAGHPRAVLVDAIRTPGGSPGTVYRLSPECLPAAIRSASSHEIDLATALVLGRRLGLAMPAELIIYAVEVEDDATFGEVMTTAVSEAVAEAASLVVDEVAGRAG